MKKTIVDQRQLTIWAGIIGPILFTATFLIEGWLRPGYEPLRMFVSALSLGPRGWVQIANFIVFGVLFLIFTRAVAAEFKSGKASRGPILLTIIASCYLLSGPFVMDPTGTPLSQTTLHGTLHGIFGAIVFSLMPITCFVFLRRFREDPKWQSLQWPTIILGTISAVGVILLTVATKLPDTQNIFSAWLGLIQRTAIVPFMLWLFICALELHRRTENKE
jgi:hypothetical protein